VPMLSAAVGIVPRPPRELGAPHVPAKGAMQLYLPSESMDEPVPTAVPTPLRRRMMARLRVPRPGGDGDSPS
jgi:hypothetical protein